MPKSDPPWYFTPLATVLGILIVIVLYIFGANLLNWISPGTVTHPFPLQFFK